MSAKMYEKVSVSVDGVDDDDTCGFCDRKKTLVICKSDSCRFKVEHARVKRTCPKHPRVIYPSDLRACSNCRHQDLCEVGVDQLPDWMIVPPVPAPTRRASPAPPVPAPTSRPSPGPMTPKLATEATPPPPASAASLGRPLAAMNGQEREPQQAPVSLIQSAAGGAAGLTARGRGRFTTKKCICNRDVQYVMCDACCFYDTKVRKRIPCPVHPENRDGIERCPSGISCPRDDLREYDASDREIVV